VIFSLLASCLVAAPASGAPVTMPGELESRRFKAAFEKGEALYQAGEFGAAIYNFRRADAQRVTAEVAYDLAKCHEKLGDAAFTLLYYRLYLRRAPEASDTLEIAQKVGAGLSKAETEGLGFLELWAPRASRLTVKGQRFAEPPVALFLPSGEHEVEAEFPSGVKKLKVLVRAGRATSVSFEPLQPPMISVENEALISQPEPGVEQAPQSSGSGPRIASYLVGGLGVAALITGLALGASASSDAALSQNKNLTISTAQSAAANANGKGVAANVLFGVGGAAIVGGVVLFVFSMPEPGLKPDSAGARR